MWSGLSSSTTHHDVDSDFSGGCSYNLEHVEAHIMGLEQNECIHMIRNKLKHLRCYFTQFLLSNCMIFLNIVYSLGYLEWNDLKGY